MTETTESGGFRLSPRASVVTALSLVALGLFRFATDTLHEADPEYWRVLDGTPLRYLVRSPSDGSFAGWLNAQWFKLLSVPAGMSLIYLRNAFRRRGLRSEADQFWHPAVRGTWTVLWLLGFTVLELEKQFQWFGGSVQQVEGEVIWLNHLAHLISAVAAWMLSGIFSFADDRSIDRS